MTRALRRAALGRLAELGVVETLAESVLDADPDLGARWLAYLSLAPASVVDDLLAGQTGE